jgi:hypothetical protein
MVNKFPEDKVPETELLLFFTVFKNICLNDDVRIDYKKIPSQTKNMINCIKKTKAGTELHKQAFKFLTNLIANLMNYIPDSRNFQFFYDIYDMGKDFQNKKEYQGPAIYMNGVYYSFGTHKSMKSTVLEYIKKYYEKLMTPERARYNLKAIAQFIRGANWVPPIMQKEGRIIYSWRNRSDRAKNEYVPTVFGIITSAPANTFKTSQHELGRSLAQLGSNDFAQFMSLVFTKVFESKFAEPNPVALCILGRIILSPRSEFLEHVPEAKTHIQIIIQNLSMMAFGVIRKVDTVKTSKAYSTSSFAAMLTSQISTTRKSSYADRLASAIYELPTYLSVPPLRADFPRKFPSSVTGKWNTIGSKRIVDEYFAAMGDVPFVIAEAKDEVNNEAQVQALSILPYLNPDMAALENIFDACLCSTVIRGRVALNALTALLLINHTNLTPFLTKFVAVSIVSQELHYQVLRVISTMLKSAMIIHLAHEDAILDVLFPFMLFSICSPVVTTRKLVWSIIEDLSIMTCGKTPNVLTTIQKNGTAISLGALNDLVQVSTILPSHEVTMIEPIPFQHVLESRYDCLYMFYLKHLGKIIAPEAASKMPFLLQSLGCVEGISKLFAANLSILITAISSKTSPLADTAGHIKQFEKYLLDIPGTPTLLPRVALYSSFDVPTILNYINMRYSSFSPELGDPYAFIVAHALTSTVRMLYKQQHDETYPLLNQFIQVLTSHMLALGISNKDLVFKFQAGPLENLDINLSMCNLNYIIERYFVELFENHHGPSESYYPLVQRFTGTIDKPIDPDELFHFLMNLNWVPKDEYELLKTTSARAFRVFTKCYSVPDNEHPTILKHLPNIQKNSDETFIYILSSSIHYYLPYYIEHVHKDPLYLRALADLFINPFDGDGFFNQWKAQAEIQYNDNIQITDQRLYTCTPQLLSIAFLNLVSHIPANRQYAFQLLNGIVFTSLFIHDRAFSSANLARLLYTIKTIVQSQQAELFEDLIIDLSAELRQQFGFCAERFIKTTFDLFKLHKKQFLFLGTVIPWIDKVVLQVKERQIIPETEEQFLSFTTYSFIFQILTDIISLPLQRQQLELIDVILEQQTGNDTINTTEAIFLLLFSIYSNHLDLEDKILGVIEYIVSRQPERMIPILLTFFSFKTELYGSLSTFYEIRVMLQEFKQEDNARVGNQSIIRHFLPLTCLIITKLLASNPDSLTQVIPVAAVLFFLRYNLDNEDTAKFSPKKMLPPLFEAVGKRNTWVTKHTDLPVDTLFQGEDKRLRNEVSIINQMIDFIYTLREEERIIAHDQLLQWGLICGDIVSSALALQL